MREVPFVEDCPVNLLSSYPPLDAMKLLDQMHLEYGDIFQLKIGGWQPNEEPMNWILLSNSELVKEFFKGDLEVLSTSRANRVLFGEMLPEHGALSLEGRTLKRHKRVISKSLNGQELQKYVADVRHFVGERIADWPNGKEKPFNLLKEVHKVTISTIMKTIFGLELGHAFQKLTDEISKLEDPSVSEEEKLRISGVLHEIIVSETERKLNLGDKDYGDDIFSLLLREKENGERALSNEEIHDELFTLLLAGFGTTSTMIVWCFETILGNNQVYTNVKAELQTVLADEQFDARHLQKLPYLQACVLETFRLRPMFLVAGARRLNKDWKIGDYLIQKDSIVANCSYLLQRNAHIWEEPTIFNPARFLNLDAEGQVTNIQKPDPFKWVPFGSGLRKCPGMAFAMQETLIVLAEILRNKDLEIFYRDDEVRDVGHDQLVKMPERHGFFIAPANGLSVFVK